MQPERLIGSILEEDTARFPSDYASSTRSSPPPPPSSSASSQSAAHYRSTGSFPSSRSSSAPPIISEQEKARWFEFCDVTEQDIEIRLDPSYYRYYHSHKPLDHRLPPPLYSPWSSNHLRDWASSADPIDSDAASFSSSFFSLAAGPEHEDESPIAAPVARRLAAGIEPADVGDESVSLLSLSSHALGSNWPSPESPGSLGLRSPLEKIQQDFPRTPSSVFASQHDSAKPVGSLSKNTSSPGTPPLPNASTPPPLTDPAAATVAAVADKPSPPSHQRAGLAAAAAPAATPSSPRSPNLRPGAATAAGMHHRHLQPTAGHHAAAAGYPPAPPPHAAARYSQQYLMHYAAAMPSRHLPPQSHPPGAYPQHPGGAAGAGAAHMQPPHVHPAYLPMHRGHQPGYDVELSMHPGAAPPPPMGIYYDAHRMDAESAAAMHHSYMMSAAAAAAAGEPPPGEHMAAGYHHAAAAAAAYYNRVPMHPVHHPSSHPALYQHPHHYQGPAGPAAAGMHPAAVMYPAPSHPHPHMAHPDMAHPAFASSKPPADYYAAARGHSGFHPALAGQPLPNGVAGQSPGVVVPTAASSVALQSPSSRPAMRSAPSTSDGRPLSPGPAAPSSPSPPPGSTPLASSPGSSPSPPQHSPPKSQRGGSSSSAAATASPATTATATTVSATSAAVVVVDKSGGAAAASISGSGLTPVRSSLLEEFRAAKNGRKFELADIYGSVVEFSGDQHGSRFIQQKLETAGPMEKERIFQEILPRALVLMIDVFGNYVIQKFFEHGTASQRQQLGQLLLGNVLNLSLQIYGCRVIQKALEVIEIEQKAAIVRELGDHVMKCVRDQNGNHVIQKCIECVPPHLIQFIVDSFSGKVFELSTHPYGCRVIQRILEHCTDSQAGTQHMTILNELLEYALGLVQDQYGNYVIQHVLVNGAKKHKLVVIQKLRSHFARLSQHKFASNVVEKCVQYADSQNRTLIIDELIGPQHDATHLVAIMKDQYANYVIQKILDNVDPVRRDEIITRIRPLLPLLRKYPYAKHIVARVEKDRP